MFQNLDFFFPNLDNLKNGRFHQHLREIFAPLVVRYVDLMETSITQSIHKGFEKEKWESKGYVYFALNFKNIYLRNKNTFFLNITTLFK